MKKLLFTVLRLALTSIMIVWIINEVDLRSVREVLAVASMPWLALGAAVNLFSVVFAAWRWQRILAGLGVFKRLIQVTRLVLIGTFFNMFLPSSVGGDVMKMVLLAPDVSRREVAVSSVLMDRVIGLAVTIGVGLAAVLLLPSVWGEPAVIATLALAVAAFCAGMVTIFNRRLIDLVNQVMPSAIRDRVGPLILRLHESLMVIGRSPRILLETAGISVLRQIAICLSVYFAGLGFGLDISPLAYFATVPIAVAITALPVAINGLGLQDNALIFLLATVGLSAPQALSLSIFLHVLRNGLGLLGGLVFALTRGRPTRAAEADAGAAKSAPAPDR